MSRNNEKNNNNETQEYIFRLYGGLSPDKLLER